MSDIQNPNLKLSYSDYVGFPDDGNRHEVIDGDHYMTPSQESYHQGLVMKLAFQLYSQVEVPGNGRVFPAPLDVLLSRVDVVQPDLIVIQERNTARIGPQNIQGAPDLVVEIVSESTADRDRGLKKTLYARSGVPEYWVVDPKAKSVEQHVLAGNRYALQGKFGDRIACRSLPGVTIDLTRVW